MKTITITNPWAGLILLGLKDVENRTWKTDYRGKLLIHSSKSSKKIKETEDYIIRNIRSEEERKKLLFNKEAMHICNTFGYILGEVELVDCIQNSESKWAEKVGVHKLYHWVLKNPVIYNEPIEAKGKLRLWEFEK